MSQDKKYVPGYYVSQKGDTVTGYFWAKDKDRLSLLKIKKDMHESEVQDISLDTCRALYMNHNFYVPWYGKRGMAYVTNFDFDLVNIDSFVTEKIPLRQLYSGNYISLFYYHDVRDHFFISKDNAILELLISYRYLTDFERMQNGAIPNSPSYFVIPSFQYQIMAFMGNKLMKNQKHLIETCGYDEYSLTSLFKTLNK
jgi:hypothetical protein